MKGKLLLLVCFLSFLNVHKTQAQKTIDLGIKGGLSIPNLTSGNDANPISDGYSSRLAIDAAMHIEFHLSKQFSIQPQLEYSSQGGKKNGKQAFTVPTDLQPLFPEGQAPPYLYANYNSIAKINYLMLPILAKYRIAFSSHWGFYIAGGPFVSTVISAENETRGNSEIFLDEQQTQALPIGPQSFDNTEKIRSDLHKANAGINGHIGFNYDLHGGSIFIEGGGNYGFIDIQKNNENGKNKTGAGVVVIGYQFRIHPRD